MSTSSHAGTHEYERFGTERAGVISNIRHINSERSIRKTMDWGPLRHERIGRADRIDRSVKIDRNDPIGEAIRRSLSEALVTLQQDHTSQIAEMARTINALDRRLETLSEEYHQHLLTCRTVNITQEGGNSSNIDRRAIMQDRFVKEIPRRLSEEPIEDGVTHSAESIINEALEDFGHKAHEWLQDVFETNFVHRPVVASGILRCVGRIDIAKVEHWGFTIASKGLKHDNIEVRDAAIRALEHWGSKKAVEHLRQYVISEPCDWLAQYAIGVIQDIEKWG